MYYVARRIFSIVTVSLKRWERNIRKGINVIRFVEPSFQLKKTNNYGNKSYKVTISNLILEIIYG
jgi:hypothetical protein